MIAVTWVGVGLTFLLAASVSSPLPSVPERPGRSPTGTHSRVTGLQAADEGYYDFPLVGTGQVPGIGRADGVASVMFADSPFGVAISADGAYRYELSVSLPQLQEPPGGHLTVWVTSPDLSHVERMGVLREGGSVGTVTLNKYLVVVTLEPTDDPGATMWSGPIVSRGTSRSGLMHSLAGHGPYETEPFAAPGYGG